MGGENEMAIGEKLWEGKGKSSGPGFIKSITAEGVTSMYSWTAQVKGMGCAEGADGNINLTAVGMVPPKGVAVENDQGIFMTMTGDMCVIKGMGMMKMEMGTNPKAVGLWNFMTMSEKLSWMNDLIAVVTFEASDPMWNEFTITINEWD
jgi:hypothetical protein